MNVWKSIWERFDANHDGVLDESEIKQLDLDGDGIITKAEIITAMRNIGFEVHFTPSNLCFVVFVVNPPISSLHFAQLVTKTFVSHRGFPSSVCSQFFFELFLSWFVL